MRKLIGLFAFLLVWSVQIGFAQTREITGRVIDKNDSSPIPGVSVVLKSNRSIGDATDINGRFSIRASDNDVLVFSFIGMKTIEVPVSGRTNITIEMESTSEALEEVIIVAYGTVKKESFTGTASVIQADAIQDLQVSSVSQALQGLASGVLVVNTSGQPGENATIRVRGIGSYSADAEPLIVLDGIPYNGNINTINPKEIESLTILKDANSTALYGSRAANGVILITTKMGREGQTRFNVSATYGLTTRAVKDYKYLNASEYMQMQWEALYNDALNASWTDGDARGYATNNLTSATVYNPFNVDNPIGTDGLPVADAVLLYDQDWADALLRTGQRQEYNLQASGGSKTMRYLISGGFLQDEGIVKTSKYNRYNIRGKIDAELKPWLKAGLNLSTSYGIANYPTQGGTSTRNTISFIRNTASIYPAYMRNRDGSYILDVNGDKIIDYGDSSEVWGRERPISSGQNPLGTFKYDDIVNKRFVSNNSLYLEAKFLSDFTFRSTLAVEYYELFTKQYYNPVYGDGSAYGGRSYRNRDLNTTITTANTLTFDKTIFDHHVNVLAGIETNDYQFERLRAEQRGFDFMEQELAYGSTPYTAYSSKTGMRNARVLGRAAYDYANKYHISASMTYDGTSRFSESKRWGTFWSIGAAWNLTQESFLENSLDVLSFLKLRVSYGTSGNQFFLDSDGVNVYFPYQATYDIGWNILGNPGVIFSSLENSKLTWEKQKQVDVGLDYSLLNGILSGSFTYFNRKSQDLLMSRPLPISAGITSYNDNVGELTNSGLEIDFKSIIFNRNDLYWDASLNTSYIKNKMTKLPAEVKNGFNGNNYKRIEKDRTIYSWYLYDFAGVDPDDGLPMWYQDVKDSDGNVTDRTTTKTYSSGTRYFLGQSMPKWTGGIFTNVRWKGLELSMMASFATGHKILDTDKGGLMHMFNSGRRGYQASKDVLKRWQQPGDITDVPKIQSSDNSFSSPSSRWLVNGAYLRMKNITLGYNFANLPRMQKAGFDNFRLFVSADNVFTVFGSKGIDPELNLHGITSNNSSALRTVSVGLNFDF